MLRFYHDKNAAFLRDELDNLLDEHPGTRAILDAIIEKERCCDVYIYGGWVRDTLLGKPFADLDVVVDAGVEVRQKRPSGDLKILGQATEALRTERRVVDSQYGDCVTHTTTEEGLTMQIWYLHETWIDIKTEGFCESLMDLFARTDFNLNCIALQYRGSGKDAPMLYMDDRFSDQLYKDVDDTLKLSANSVLEFVNPRLWYPRRLTGKALKLLRQHPNLRAGPRLLNFFRNQMEAGYRAQDREVGAQNGKGPVNESTAEELLVDDASSEG